MSNSSRIACSLAPAYFHHCRSKARISRSRSDSSPPTGCPPGRAARSIVISRAISRILATYTGVILARTGDRTWRLAEVSGIKAAGPVGLGDPAGADYLRRRAQRRPLVVGERGDLLVGAFHDRLEPVVPLVLGPPVGLQVLHPLVVGDRDAAGVGEDVRDDDHAPALEDLVGVGG